MDPVPVHREPIYTPRRDLIEKYPALYDRRDFRVPQLARSIQFVDHAHDFPMILTSGRIVEYEGGGDETRSSGLIYSGHSAVHAYAAAVAKAGGTETDKIIAALPSLDMVDFIRPDIEVTEFIRYRGADVIEPASPGKPLRHHA